MILQAAGITSQTSKSCSGSSRTFSRAANPVVHFVLGPSGGFRHRALLLKSGG